MKHLPLLLILTACSTYQSFVTVTPRSDVPKGTTEFIVHASLDRVKSALKASTIAYSVNDVGIQTEEILLDEGTRAIYKAYVLDSVTTKIIPTWGVTQKVEADARIWVGYAATGMSQDMQRVVYNKDLTRPKKVFDYGVQIFSAAGVIDYRKS